MLVIIYTSSLRYLVALSRFSWSTYHAQHDDNIKTCRKLYGTRKNYSYLSDIEFMAVIKRLTVTWK